MQVMGGSAQPRPRRKRSWIALAWSLGGVVAVSLGTVAVLLYKVATYVDPWQAQVAAAGYVEKTAQLHQVKLSYVEGPSNGPPLVLLHAQHMDWFSYSRVLPALARSFHVFDVDYPGHGKTTTPADYPMTANRIGTDLAEFIESHIGEPVFITGNSSGGLLATWLAAHRPELIKAALLEDPPLFSAEYPRIKQTIADRSFATSQRAVQDRTPDFLLYWIHDNAPFFQKNVGPGTPFLLTEAIKAYRRTNPGKPVEIGLLPNDTVRLLVRGLDEYDPRFGAAFHDGSWNQGFDHADTLRKIACPTLLLQANSSTRSDGTLVGAMTPEDAARAMSLLKNGKFVRVDASHVVHLDKPQEFITLLEGFFLRQ